MMTVGTQGYSGILLDMRWRRGQNFFLSTNYTWSHCLGLETITLLNPGAQHLHQAYQNNGSDDRNLDIGNCVADRRQIFNTTMIAKVPNMGAGAFARLLSDWSLFSTIFQARSGQPLNIVAGADFALNGFTGNSATQRLNQVLADVSGDNRR